MSRLGSSPILSSQDGSIQWQQGRGLLNVGGATAVVRPVSEGGTVGDIQKAIDKVSRDGGGTVFIRIGTYQETENILLKSKVNIIGEKESATVIDFNGTGNYIEGTGTDTYVTGTITSITGGKNVTGSGTSWLSNITTNHSLYIANRWYSIEEVTSDTAIVLKDVYIGNATFPSSYRSTVLVEDINLSEFTTKNSVLYGINLDSSKNIVMNNITSTGNGTGIALAYVTELTADSVVSSSNTSEGINIINSGFFDLESVYSISNGSNGFGLNSCDTIHFGVCVANTNGGDGFNLSSVDNSSLFVEARGNTQHGIELVGGCDLNLVTGSILSNNTLDGIQLTATSDRNIIQANVLNTNGAYGVDIASNTCDKNLIHGNQFISNTSGTINDSGTSTTSADNVT